MHAIQKCVHLSGPVLHAACVQSVGRLLGTLTTAKVL